ncbi:NAD(P)-dependent alcohol dehydrogenase [Devosia sp. SL43]|uniref:NAD(P)-dependent alcohol dehydrogenase n=1 Tax=Devosia sp. SL43 TaxID=2806348 RepID=UPI001F318653|nr:NAD(P)-dependent alcohol dehydrogenase [Devosia sp. SL43]UJW85285.1 NAD(P)-dependent alcohol dehydrogenase [Devosia sp. SL43]
MKTAVQTAYGKPEVVVIRDTPKPVAGDNEVLVKVMATTVTSGDSRMRAFRIPAAFWLPARLFMGITKPRKAVLGVEFAGTVEAIGKSVTRFAVGDRVFGLHIYGAHAEYKVVPDDAAIATMPDGVSFEQAAAIPFGALTAQFFLRKADIKPGQKVLVNGASGAVGCFAVQLARHYGALVTGVCTAANAELVRGLGASAVIDYKSTNFSRTGEQFDVIVDTIGNISLGQFRRTTTASGILLAVDGGGTAFLRAAWTGLFGSRKVIAAVSEDKQADLESVRDLVAAGTLRPTIDSRYPFDEIVKAHARVDSGRKRGAVVVIMAEAQTALLRA